MGLFHVITTTTSGIFSLAVVCLLLLVFVWYVRKLKKQIHHEIKNCQDIENRLDNTDKRFLESFKLMDKILRYTHVSLVYLDPDFNFIWVNQAYAEACGYPQQYFTGKNHFDLYPHKENEAIFRRVIETGKPFFIAAKPFEFPDHPEWGISYWDWSLIPVLDDESRVNALIFSLENVSDRVKAEKNYEMLFREMLDGFALFDVVYHESDGSIDFRFVSVNPAFETVMNVDSSSIQGSTVTCVFGSEASEWINIFRGVTHSGKPDYFELFIRSLEKHLKVSVFKPLPGRIACVVVDVTEKIKTHAQLKSSEERFKKVFERSPLLMTISTIDDGIYIDVNDAFARVTGYQPHDVLGRSSREIGFISDNERARIGDALREGESIIDMELELSRSDGSRMVCLYSAEIVMIDGEKRLLSIASDITKRKDAELALVESENRWKNILINTPQIGISLNSRASIVFANRHFLEFTGWKETEIIGKNWFDMFIPEEIRENVRTVFSKVMKQKDTHGFTSNENEIVKKDGSRVLISWSNVLSKDMNGNIVDVTCLGVDLTERVFAENQLRDRERKYRSLFENSNDGIILHDFQGRILDCNVKICDLLGYSESELKKMTVSQLHPETECELSKTAFQTTIIQGHAEFETIFLTKENSVKYVDISSSIIDDKNCIIQGIIRDVTERKQVEERLRQSQKMESIGNLAGGIAHDFNNLLFPIIGLAELIIDDLPAGSPEYQNAVEILKAGKRGEALVKQILAFSRQTEYKRKPIRLQQVISDVMKLLRATIPSYINLKIDLDDQCGTIEADPTQIHQVAMNIVTNAYHATDYEDGSISVTVKQVELEGLESSAGNLEGSYAMLSVVDTGTGMTEHVKSKIFEPYFTTKEKDKGTGLGLAVVYGIVKKHGGEIKVYSEPGEGTRFDVYLPIMTRFKGESSHQRNQDIPTGNERILIVDDEKSIVNLQQKILTRLGYTVTAFDNSRDALNTFSEDPMKYDLILTDMTMPYMTGEQLTKEIKTIRPDIKVVICSGFNKKINCETSSRLSSDGFLMKPVEKQKLAETIRKVLDQ